MEVAYLGFGSGFLLRGNIDDIKIWNRTLSAQEITNLYANGNPTGPNGNESNWSAFTAPLYGNGNATVPNTIGNIIQYRADFTSTSMNYSAFLRNVSITYDTFPTGVPNTAPQYYFAQWNASSPVCFGSAVTFGMNWTDNSIVDTVEVFFDNGTGTLTSIETLDVGVQSAWVNTRASWNSPA